MINPTHEDIGREVVYEGGAGEREFGIISSYNDYFVFVKYDGKRQVQATRREDLWFTTGAGA